MSMVVIGAVFVDIKGFPKNLYIPAGRNDGTVKVVHGGVGRNVAEDIANMELRPKFLSIVDDTAQGQDVLRKLQNHKVNTDYMLTVPDGMGMWLAVFDHTGDIVGSISKRPDLMPIAQLLEEKGDEIFSDADSVAIEIDMEKEIIKQVFKYAKKYNLKIYAVVSNMSIALQRRDFFKSIDCFVCNRQEAGILFAENFDDLSMPELRDAIAECIRHADIPAMVVTSGADGSVYCSLKGEIGIKSAEPVMVKDTTGAGDSFFAGVAAGLTYGKTLSEAVAIGARIASSVIACMDNVCPRFQPQEFGLLVDEKK